MQTKDKRYLTAKTLIESGNIKHFRDIFDREIISRSKVAKDMGFNYNRFSTLVENTEGWVFKDVYKMSTLFDVEERIMMNLIHEQYLHSKRARKKK